MDIQLYVRMRGRVLGPFDEGKLQGLAKRGQLSRLHEVSQDAMVWVRASEYPDLFLFLDGTGAGKAEPDSNKASSGRGILSSQPSQQTVASSPSAKEGRCIAQEDGHVTAATKRWWYRKNGADAGPVETTALQQMLTSGMLSHDDEVWTEGMAQWAPARQVPDLVPGPVDAHTQAVWGERSTGTSQEISELPTSLCKAAVGSRAWVMFVAVVSFVYAGLAVVAGIFALIQGANEHLAPVVAWGLFELIFAVDVAAGGFLLLTYASHMASLRYNSHPMVLEKAMDTLRTLWIYVSVNLIVMLMFLLFVVVWLVAIGGTLPLS